MLNVAMHRLEESEEIAKSVIKSITMTVSPYLFLLHCTLAYEPQNPNELVHSDTRYLYLRILAQRYNTMSKEDNTIVTVVTRLLYAQVHSVTHLQHEHVKNG